MHCPLLSHPLLVYCVFSWCMKFCLWGRLNDGGKKVDAKLVFSSSSVGLGLNIHEITQELLRIHCTASCSVKESLIYRPDMEQTFDSTIWWEGVCKSNGQRECKGNCSKLHYFDIFIWIKNQDVLILFRKRYECLYVSVSHASVWKMAYYGLYPCCKS